MIGTNARPDARREGEGCRVVPRLCRRACRCVEAFCPSPLELGLAATFFSLGCYLRDWQLANTCMDYTS